MSSDAGKQRSRARLRSAGGSCAPLRSAPVGLALSLAGGSLAGGSLAGCVMDGVRPAQAVVASADRGTCEGRYVQSIWKGEDLSGPECASYGALAVRALDYDRRRVQKVCEQTQIRTILSGEASTRFTLQACATHEPRYQQARLGRACQEASRVRRRLEEELTAAQSAVCKTYLEPASFSNAAQRVASRAAPLLPARGNAFAALPARVGEAPEAAPGDVAAGGVAVGSAIPGSVAASGAVAGSVAASGAAPELASCEDRYVESIWKGVDVTGGAECASYVGADGSARQFRLSRIQNVCEGAEIRSVRKGEALPAFTAHACQGIFAARRLPAEAPVAEGSAPVVVLAVTAPAPEAPRGLDEKTIASTVDVHWRSIGRDCLAVAPQSGSLTEPANTAVTVTITVAASGQVRTASARARGYPELESCIEQSVRGWSFPPAAGDTEVGLPLVFVGR